MVRGAFSWQGSVGSNGPCREGRRAGNRNMRHTKLLVALASMTLTGVVSHARQYASTDLARQFAYSLERTGREAIAVADPSDRGMFVAALLVRSDLLVVRARHPSVDKISAEIRARQYLQVFSALRATPTPADTLFIHDVSADGILSSLPDAGRVDIARDNDGPAIRFDGAVAGQGLTAAEYDRRLAATDAEYARVLKLLSSAVR